MKNIYIIGGGPGDSDLITCKGKKIVDQSHYIFASSKFISNELFQNVKAECKIMDTFDFNYDQKLEFAKKAVAENKIISFITMGDPAFYGMVMGLIDRFEKNDLEFELVPGISAASASSSKLKRGLTSMGIASTVTFTSFNEVEKSSNELRLIAESKASVCIFMGIRNLKEVVEIFEEKRGADTPIAILSKVSWKEEKIIKGNMKNIITLTNKEGIEDGLILVGEFLEKEYDYELEKVFFERKRRENENN